DLPIDARSYRQAIEILQELEISSVNLLTNNPEKISALERAGVQVTARIPLLVPANKHSDAYLATKRTRMGHFYNFNKGMRIRSTASRGCYGQAFFLAETIKVSGSWFDAIVMA
ncbi:MAG: hypothetical protein IIA75_00925, partial [Proteobacteria bacterium]|nr:hypothetical protein [Pseudomonadota bacterium]